MAISIVSTLEHSDTSRQASPWVSSSALTLATGDRVLVFGGADLDMGTVTVSLNGSSPPSFTELEFANTSFGNGGSRGAWLSGEMPDNSSRSVSLAWTSGNNIERSGMFCLVIRGAHATTPVPAGNSTISSTGDTDGHTVSITPTAAGSLLFMFVVDTALTTLGAAANCGINPTACDVATVALIQPTTQPRVDTSAFSIGYTATAAEVGWLAFEVQAAASDPTVALTGSASTSGRGTQTPGTSVEL
jgi:hypothetical protein